MVFADRLVEATRNFGPLCVGLDPHPQSIPTFFGADPLAALANWCEEIVSLAAHHCGIIKPQIGLFEPYGPEGLAVFQDSLRQARSLGLITLCDAKRGDIGSTAKGYARAYLAVGAAFESDAVTLNPYLGRDSIAPFIDVAKDAGKGVIILGRTSNPGASDIQMKPVDGTPIYEHVVHDYAEDCAALMGESAWSGLMWVVGATAPDAARRIRQLAPSSLVLVPGFGAQGGSLNDALASFVRNPDGGRLEGGVINASRSVTAPKAALDSESLVGWRAEIKSVMADTSALLMAATA